MDIENQEGLLALGMQDVTSLDESLEHQREAEIAMIVLTSELALNRYMLITCGRGLKDMSEWPPQELEMFLSRFGHHGACVTRDDIHDDILSLIPHQVLEHLGLSE